MDPITAGFNAATALLNFLSTPAGQNILADLRALNGNVSAQIGGIIASVAAHAPAPPSK